MVKPTIGLIEPIKVMDKKFLAKVDTGAKRSSMDLSLARKLGLTKSLWGIRKVRSSNGESYRPVIKTKICFANQEMPATFTICRRGNLKHKILIGVNVLKNGFIIDSSK
jgi:hypothetical protein